MPPPDQPSGVIEHANSSVDLDAAIERATKVCFQLSAVLFTVLACIQFTGVNPFASQTAHAAPTASQMAPAITWYTYQANFNEVQSIVNWGTTSGHNWPEHVSNWCGVANIQTINAYDYWEQGISSQNPYPSQESVASLLNSSAAESPWGYPKYGGNGFGADIAADGGTDPRSIAWALYTASPNNYFYHNYIYTGNYPGGDSVDHATRNFASDYGNYGLNNPISVTVNGGMHSVVVSGVQASGDPSANPNGVALHEILVWDPWYGNTQFGSPTYYNTTGVWQWWNIGDWEGTSGVTKWWGQTYNTGNGYDPDPLTSPGNWYNVPPLPSHWGGNYITIEQDTIPPGTYSENIALDNNGNQVPYNCAVKICS